MNYLNPEEDLSVRYKQRRQVNRIIEYKHYNCYIYCITCRKVVLRHIGHAGKIWHKKCNTEHKGELYDSKTAYYKKRNLKRSKKYKKRNFYKNAKLI